MQICNLCQINKADKLKSHIIPKFLSKRIFEHTKPRYTLAMRKTGKAFKIQDTPKEDNILCEECERRFEFIETLFSRKITSINNFTNLKNDFDIVVLGKNKILECLKVNPTSFKIFIYSLIWRASISKLEAFDKFKLPNEVEDNLRFFLNKNLCSSHSELINSFDKIVDTPEYHFIVFKPEFRNESARGIYSAYQIDVNKFGVFTVDFSIFFHTKEESIDPLSKIVSNKQNEKVRMVLTGTDKWRELNNSVVYRMLKKQ